MLRALMVSVALLAATSARATTMWAMDVAELSRVSDVVVRANVVRVEPRLTADGARIMTDTELKVLEVLKGPTVGDSVVAMQPGGELGETGQHVAGTAKFVVGEEVVVFLERRGDRFLVAGMSQGKLKVDRSSGAPVVRGADDADALLLDPKTRQPVKSLPVAMTLGELSKHIREAQPQAPVQQKQVGKVTP